MWQRRKTNLLILLCAAGSLFLNFPLLSIFDKAQFIMGIPLLYIYMGVIWLMMVLVLYGLSKFFQQKTDQPHE